MLILGYRLNCGTWVIWNYKNHKIINWNSKIHFLSKGNFQNYNEHFKKKSLFLRYNKGDSKSRTSHPEAFLVKRVLEICSKFTGEHPCWSVISINLLCDFIEITLKYWCSSVNLLQIFRAPFSKNISGELLLDKVSVMLKKT